MVCFRHGKGSFSFFFYNKFKVKVLKTTLRLDNISFELKNQAPNGRLALRALTTNVV